MDKPELVYGLNEGVDRKATMVVFYTLPDGSGNPYSRVSITYEDGNTCLSDVSWGGRDMAAQRGREYAESLGWDNEARFTDGWVQQHGCPIYVYEVQSSYSLENMLNLS